MVAERAHGQHPGCQALLPVDDQPAAHVGGLHQRAWCQHNRPEEVGRAWVAVGELVGLFKHVVPELLEVGLGPGVGPLEQWHLELLLALDEFLEGRLSRLHAPADLQVTLGLVGRKLHEKRDRMEHLVTVLTNSTEVW